MSIWAERSDKIDRHNAANETISMTARRSDFWEEWGRAMERNGKRIEEVLLAESNEWLQGNDWKVVLKELYPANPPEPWIFTFDKGE